FATAVAASVVSSSATADAYTSASRSMTEAMLSFSRSTCAMEVFATPSPMHSACDPQAPSEGGSTTFTLPLEYGVLLLARFGASNAVTVGALGAVAFAVATAAAAAVCDALELLRELLRDGWWYGGTLCATLKAVSTSLALCISRSSDSHVLSPSASYPFHFTRYVRSHLQSCFVCAFPPLSSHARVVETIPSTSYSSQSVSASGSISASALVFADAGARAAARAAAAAARWRACSTAAAAAAAAVSSTASSACAAALALSAAPLLVEAGCILRDSTRA